MRWAGLGSSRPLATSTHHFIAGAYTFFVLLLLNLIISGVEATPSSSSASPENNDLEEHHQEANLARMFVGNYDPPITRMQRAPLRWGKRERAAAGGGQMLRWGKREPLRWGKRSNPLRWGKRAPLRWGKRSGGGGGSAGFGGGGGEIVDAVSDADTPVSLKLSLERDLRSALPEANQPRFLRSSPLRWGKRSAQADDEHFSRWARAPLRYGKRSESGYEDEED